MVQYLQKLTGSNNFETFKTTLNEVSKTKKASGAALSIRNSLLKTQIDYLSHPVSRSGKQKNHDEHKFITLKLVNGGKSKAKRPMFSKCSRNDYYYYCRKLLIFLCEFFLWQIGARVSSCTIPRGGTHSKIN